MPDFVAANCIFYKKRRAFDNVIFLEKSLILFLNVSPTSIWIKLWEKPVKLCHMSIKSRRVMVENPYSKW